MSCIWTIIVLLLFFDFGVKQFADIEVDQNLSSSCPTA